MGRIKTKVENNTIIKKWKRGLKLEKKTNKLASFTSFD